MQLANRDLNWDVNNVGNSARCSALGRIVALGSPQLKAPQGCWPSFSLSSPPSIGTSFCWLAANTARAFACHRVYRVSHLTVTTDDITRLLRSE